MRNQKKPYRIIGAYDSETTNIKIDGIPKAYPILHQIGLLDGTSIEDIKPENVVEHVQIELYRNTIDLYSRLDSIVETSSDYVPVILCHNLSFDIYGLSPWLDRHDVRVLAKSARKPISLSIKLDDEIRLVIWDTLIFSQQSLERMGTDCEYRKAVGKWDYDKIRTPNTILTDDEIRYAQDDIYTLICWFGWWLPRNPDISPEKLGCNVVTKTGIVRERRKQRFSKLKGNGMKYNAGHYWTGRCETEKPKSDDELFTNFACTRGGFTFCASESASIPYVLDNTDYVIAGYDATSQHPAQIVSHYYPFGFKERTPKVLEQAFDLIGCISLERILAHWDKPFPVAFNAAFEFVNLHPKTNTVFSANGIFPLANARYKSKEQEREQQSITMDERGYCDSGIGMNGAFGKIISAERIILYLTELSSWEIWQAYEWDSVVALHGYETGNFCRPSDLDVISVMQFYKAKNEFKNRRKEYLKSGKIKDGSMLLELGIAPMVVSQMEDGSLSIGDLEAQYLSLKADLNAIYGISCSNEYRRDTILGKSGIEYTGDFGLCNAPKVSKVWYQFGQRIVGWSRIAQTIVMMLSDGIADKIINGDTDSIKLLIDEGRISELEKAFSRLSCAIDSGKKKTCLRVEKAYPNHFDELEYIGHYEREFVTKRFCASWNKAYCIQDDDEKLSFTIAGIPTKRRENDFSCFIGIDGYAQGLYKDGWSFEDISSLFLGYNVTYSYDLIRMNGRKFPEWGDYFTEHVTDCNAQDSYVVEPCALALYPISKTINDTSNFENAINAGYAKSNNPDVNTEQKILTSAGILDFEGIEL